MRPTRALVHRRFLLENLETIRQSVPPGTAICAAVKANAYGHGAVEVSKVLVQAGVEALGVATVEEGQSLRASGISQRIFLLGTLQADEIASALEADLDVFVWTKEAVTTLAQAARGRSKPLGVHLKVDTGMGRVGCRPEEAEDLARAIVHSLELEFMGVCTHFASSDGPGPLGVLEQLERFLGVLSNLAARGWTPQFIHAANSGAVASWPSAHFNLVRPGIALYGYGPAATRPWRPAMELVTRVGYVKTVPAGTPLSYGSKYFTERETDVATLPVGYADGYRRAFTNRAPLWIGGKTYRVSGTVCMDQFLVDLGPASGIKAGDPVVLFGAPEPGRPVPTAEDLAALDGTISYEILCNVSSRVPRIFVD